MFGALRRYLMIERTGFPSLPCDLPDDLLTVRAADGGTRTPSPCSSTGTVGPLLATACCMLGSVQDAEDAVQDAFVSAWRRLPEYHHHAQFRTWMYRITVNRCLTMLSRRPPDLPPWTPYPNRQRATCGVRPCAAPSRTPPQPPCSAP